MYYAIDFDTRSVESKSTDGELLAAYVLDNDLNMAVAIVDSEDELCFQFSLKELKDLYEQLCGERKEFDNDENLAASACWELLEENQHSFQDFTPSLGKKLLKAAAKRCKDSNSKNTKGSSTKPTSKRRTSSKTAGKRLTDETVLTLGEQPKESTLPFKVWQIVEDNFGDMSIGDIVKEAGDWCEVQCRKQISRCIRKGFLIKVEEEL